METMGTVRRFKHILFGKFTNKGKDRQTSSHKKESNITLNKNESAYFDILDKDVTKIQREFLSINLFDFQDVGFLPEVISTFTERIKSDTSEGFIFFDNDSKLPNSCGVYLVLGMSGVVMYVGKTNALRNRFKQRKNKDRVGDFMLKNEYKIAFLKTTCGFMVEAIFIEFFKPVLNRRSEITFL